jgi:dolichol-phosphate mannosyltransferase
MTHASQLRDVDGSMTAPEVTTKNMRYLNDKNRGPELSIIAPTFNEIKNIESLAQQIDEALGDVRWELIIVDDASPDGTAKFARTLGQRDPRIRCIYRLGRRGLAGACIEGFLSSSADVLAVMDADLQHDSRLLAKMLERIRNGSCDIVIASRYGAGGTSDGFSAARQQASNLSTKLARFSTGVQVSDPMSGFFMIRRDAFEPLAPYLAVEGFKILLDILATARGRLRIEEETYSFAARTEGASKFDVQNVLDFVGLLASKMSAGIIPIRFMNFALVGFTGVGVHLVALKILLATQATFNTAQVIATVCAMTSNFFMNNLLTYRDRRKTGLGLITGLLMFYAICGIGAFSNIGIANWLYGQSTVWWVAGLTGSLVGAVWNFAVSSRLLWRK